MGNVGAFYEKCKKIVSNDREYLAYIRCRSSTKRWSRPEVQRMNLEKREEGRRDQKETGNRIQPQRQKEESDVGLTGSVIWGEGIGIRVAAHPDGQ